MPEPERFCRYRSLSGDSALWVHDSIVHSKHYFASPLAFNDPFDCRPNFTLNGTKSQLQGYFEQLLSRQAPHLNRNQRRAEARRRTTDPEFDPRLPENMAAFRDVYHRTVTANVGVLCLSEVVDDILMWAHYADAHRGVCLVLDAADEFFATAQPVGYRAERPTINPLKHTAEHMLDAALFTKSSHWSYEREWRILQYKRGAGTYTVPTHALHEVILGAQVSEENRQVVGAWVAASPAKPRLRQAKLSAERFEIEIVDV